MPVREELKWARLGEALGVGIGKEVEVSPEDRL
jgi:hypothetical protein